MFIICPLRTSNRFATWTFTVNVQQGGCAYKLRVVNQAIRRRTDLPLVYQLVEGRARDAELARGLGFSQPAIRYYLERRRSRL